MAKIAVLTSGGVDSSVALALLKAEGHDLTAFYLKIWLEDELSFLGDCPWQEDLEYVQSLCQQFDVPLQIIHLQKEYFDRVIKLALEQVKSGLTPNPDIFCNSMIKFGAFLDKVGNDFDFVATGHYADVFRDQNHFTWLKESPDLIKDQTYFLAQLSQEQLSKALFPIGKFSKAQVRELAEKYDIPAKNRKDSQGLCFLGKIRFDDFLKANIGTKQGDLVEFETGKVLAKHQGFWFYTIGQRRGIGLSHGPWFVVKKDAAQNIVYISNKYYTEEKERDSFFVSDFHWLSKPLQILDGVQVKLRHGPKKYSCSIQKLDGKNFVKIDGQDQGISAGQFAVFYKDGLCVASAMIL